MNRFVAPWTLAAALALGAPGARGDEAHDHAPKAGETFDYVPGAALLEGRLLSPCCWEKNGGQTLDIHRSPAADQLRKEIRQRLRAGETPEALEAALVKRYTTRILAVPNSSPLPRMGPLLAVGLALGLGLAVSIIVRWRRGSRRVSEGATTAETGAEKDVWDRRLDEEMDRAD